MSRPQRGPAGEQVPQRELNLSFLDIPALHHSDVIAKLGQIDTGCQDPHLVWGRWAESKWGDWGYFVAAAPGASQAAVAGDAKCLWHVRNLIVAFDENGVIETKHLINHDRALWRQLHHSIAPEPPFDFSHNQVILLNRKIRTHDPDPGRPRDASRKERPRPYSA